MLEIALNAARFNAEQVVVDHQKRRKRKSDGHHLTDITDSEYVIHASMAAPSVLASAARVELLSQNVERDENEVSAEEKELGVLVKIKCRLYVLQGLANTQPDSVQVRALLHP